LISLQERNCWLPNLEVHKGKHNCRTNSVVISSNSQQTTSDLKKLGAPCTHLQHYKKPQKINKNKSKGKAKQKQEQKQGKHKAKCETGF
jgi:hypothetical protein